MNPKFKGLEGSLGAVYYNFPHAGSVGGFFDGHPLVNWRHENLMRLFFRALRSFMTVGGLVKVASNMGAVGVRFSYITFGAKENEFDHVETVPFLQWNLHRYSRSYGDRRDVIRRPDQAEGYNAQRADKDMVYTFKYNPSGKPLPPQALRLPPTLMTLEECQDGQQLKVEGVRAALQQQRSFVFEDEAEHLLRTTSERSKENPLANSHRLRDVWKIVVAQHQDAESESDLGSPGSPASPLSPPDLNSRWRQRSKLSTGSAFSSVSSVFGTYSNRQGGQH
ncbi:unnamed protein product [Durusdinium trenchii]|uniref:Uncharacterized protein n=1 Tax=Durusdinium trenchii TaxID=1381693 RepID=A0ABP0MG74_9DINO